MICSTKSYNCAHQFCLHHADFTRTALTYNAVLSISSTNICLRSTMCHADFPGGSVVKNLPAMQETWVWSLGQEDPLEKERATHFRILFFFFSHFSIPTWRTPCTEEPGRLQFMGLQKSKTPLSDYNSNNNVACSTLGAGLRYRLFRHKSGLHHLFPDYACDISHNLGQAVLPLWISGLHQ